MNIKASSLEIWKKKKMNQMSAANQECPPNGIYIEAYENGEWLCRNKKNNAMVGRLCLNFIKKPTTSDE